MNVMRNVWVCVLPPERHPDSEFSKIHGCVGELVVFGYVMQFDVSTSSCSHRLVGQVRDDSECYHCNDKEISSIGWLRDQTAFEGTLSVKSVGGRDLFFLQMPGITKREKGEHKPRGWKDLQAWRDESEVTSSVGG